MALGYCRGSWPDVRCAALAIALVPTLASADPGDVLVTEFETGSVARLGEGGDLAEAERFATGLSAPTGICVGPGGDIYATELVAGGGGEITIITEGGDFTDAPSFAQSSSGLTGLWCDDETIYVGALGPPGQGIVIDASQGGNVTLTGDFLGIAFPVPADLVVSDDGDLFNANGDIYDVGSAFDFSKAEPYTTGRFVFALANRDGQLLAGDNAVPEIVDFTEGGDLLAADVFATLPELGTGVHGLLATQTGEVYVLLADTVFLVPAEGGDLRDAEPFAWGLTTGQVGYHDMAEHVCSSDSDCADEDLCNGDERCVSNRCLPARAPLDCDDDDPCTADACDADEGCLHEVLAGCCTSDEVCAIDEVCDVDALECVELDPIPGDDGGDEGESEGDTGGSDDGSAGGSEGGPQDDSADDDDAPAGPPGDSTGAADADDGFDAADEDGDGAQGCGCTNASHPVGPLFALLFGLAAYRPSRHPRGRRHR